jgi:hypothetical protein
MPDAPVSGLRVAMAEQQGGLLEELLHHVLLGENSRNGNLCSLTALHIAPLGWEHISFNGDYV